MPNRLALESSPYLRQHMDNPVDWYPWGDEALARARAEDKPLLLSVGYAACHWCHVMAHESFEDPATAELMNAAFINVKVDREERPDIDAIYMRAVQALTRHGGWPMTVFLTPDGAPFFGGTYFPPVDRHGMPSFRRVLASVADAWRTRRAEVVRGAADLLRIYDDSPAEHDASADDALLEGATRAVLAQYDRQRGGFGGAPKFPPTMTLDFLLRRWARTDDGALLEVVRHSWDGMVRGGLFDQIGGGFHRYTVDGEWLVPHFEKMLYDNALLVRLGAHLWQVTKDPGVREAVEATLAWVEREMTAPDGGFYASLDADSEGHEGKFYVWSLPELLQRLGADAALLTAYWGATPAGNFEGNNILHRPRPDAEFAAGRAIDSAALAAAIARGRAALLAARDQRARPARDEKIIAAWNGLMLRGVADCARIFRVTRWRSLAVRAAAFLHHHLVRDGRARRVYAGGKARVTGFLEDHAALGLGFLAVYELTFEDHWLARARVMADACARFFWDEATGAYYDAAADAPPLVTRPRDAFDNATPSGTSLAVELQQRLAALDGEGRGAERVERVLASLVAPMRQIPMAFGHLLCTADAETHGEVSVVLSGAGPVTALEALRDAASSCYVPALVLVSGQSHGVPIAAGKGAPPGDAVAYVCRGFSCAAPTSDPNVLVAQLSHARRA